MYLEVWFIDWRLVFCLNQVLEEELISSFCQARARHKTHQGRLLWSLAVWQSPSVFISIGPAHVLSCHAVTTEGYSQIKMQIRIVLRSVSRSEKPTFELRTVNHWLGDHDLSSLSQTKQHFSPLVHYWYMNGINHDRINQFVKTWVVWALTGCMTAACSLHARNIHSDIFVFTLHTVQWLTDPRKSSSLS